MLQDFIPKVHESWKKYGSWTQRFTEHTRTFWYAGFTDRKRNKLIIVCWSFMQWNNGILFIALYFCFTFGFWINLCFQLQTREESLSSWRSMSVSEVEGPDGEDGYSPSRGATPAFPTAPCTPYPPATPPSRLPLRSPITQRFVFSNSIEIVQKCSTVYSFLHHYTERTTPLSQHWLVHLHNQTPVLWNLSMMFLPIRWSLFVTHQSFGINQI